MPSIREIFKGLSFFKDKNLDSLDSTVSSEPLLKESLLSANYFLSAQIEKNEKCIESLQSLLSMISSSSNSINPELGSLMLTSSSNEENYDFELLLVGDFTKIICKSKYFNFIVELKPLTEKIIPHNERIYLKVKLYSSDAAPKQLISTIQGKPIMRGRCTETMTFKSAENKFLVRIKMQIKEVSSHFMNGNVNLVVAQKINGRHSIKPLVIREIVVKAKEKACKRWREQGL